MSRRAATRATWSLWGLAVVLAALAVLFYLLSLSIPLEGRDRPPLEFLPVMLLAILSFSTIGALVASRHPANAIGWISCLLGIFLGAAFLAQGYADYALIVQPGSLPGGEIAVWSFSWSGIILTVAPTFLLLLFPDGRLPSRRWRPVVWIAAAGAAAAMIGAAFRPGLLDDDYPMVINPVGIEGVLGDFLSLLNVAGGALVAVALLLSAASLVVRFRRSQGEERQQIKWIVYAGAIMVTAFLVGSVVPGDSGSVADLLWAIGFIALVGIPIAAGLAILKYRLYDIDAVINRTLVYGAMTATLALVYFGGVATTQTIFRALIGQEKQSQLAIVFSTLLIAALFNPLRRRMQGFIDRHFYRRKYDAQKTLANFSAKLRDETDIEQLREDLISAVQETMQPEHVSLWLRPAGRARRSEER